ncbi:MAG TPA: Ig-like domain-containing protein [bacterium]|jgi:hypothetical protein|nr:Ig-like domain-containing protein [bacterium]
MIRQAKVAPIKSCCGCSFTIPKLLILALLLFLAQPGSAKAQAADSLEIYGPGVETPVTFSLSELEAMEQYEQVYSAVNTYPTKQWYIARGVRLKDLFNQTGLTADATLMRFYSRDGYDVTFTVKELLTDKRYYFPGLMENHHSDGSIAGSPEGAAEVEPVLALLSAEGSDNPEHMNDKDTLLLVLGQRAITEQVSPLFVKRVNRIELMTKDPVKWDQPRLNVPSGLALPLDTGLVLENKGSDADKIYYTTDGSTPTVNSPIFNWSASRWWPLRGDLATVNAPIKITKDMVVNIDGQDMVIIKARTIGPGKEDSDVATFTFAIDPEAADPSLGPGSRATGIFLDQNQLYLSPGSAFHLQATVEPFNAISKEVSWESSDTSVATVDTKGLVTMVGPGSAIITAKTADGSYSASCIINGPDQEDEDKTVEDEEQDTEPTAASDDDPPPKQTGRSAEPTLDFTSQELQADDGQQYLAAREEPTDSLSRAQEKQTGTLAPGVQIFELLPIRASATVEEEEPNLFSVLVFFLLLLSGGAKKYLEYVKEL